MIVRKCREEDVDEVYEIEKVSFLRPYPKLFFHHYLSEHFFVAERNGKIVGYIIADIKRNLIVSLAVHPSFRRRGYGRALMQHVMDYMRGEILLQVRKSNESAIKFYEKMGFRKKGELRGYYTDGEDAVIMVRRKD